MSHLPFIKIIFSPQSTIRTARLRLFAGYSLSNLAVLTLLISAVIACQLGAPTSTATPPQALETQEVADKDHPSATQPAAGGAEPTRANTPTKAPPSPTPTPLVGLANVVDDGAPLPPQVVAQSPERGQAVSVNAAIEITFDQAMNTGATGPALQVIGPEAQPVSGQITWPSEDTLRFLPDQPLTSGAAYLASLTTQAASAQGVAIQEAISFDFTTVGELQVTQVFPADGVDQVESDAVITIIFNRPVAPLGIVEEQGSLPQPLQIDPPTPGKGEWINTSVYAFTPDEPLAGAKTYTAIVSAGLSDATGDSALAADFRWQFTTAAPSLAFLELSNGVFNPATGYTNFMLDDTFHLSFMQPMERNSTEAALSLSGLWNGEAVPLEIEWNEQSTTVTLTPTVRLELGVDYVLHLGSEAQAASGGSLAEGLDWRFTTVPPPAILYTYPANGDTQGYYDGSFRIYFASPMRLDEIADTISFSPAVAELSWYYSEWDWSLSFYGLAPSTRYEVTIQPGLSDIYGNVLNESQTIRFTTAGREPMARLQMPYNLALFRADGPQRFYATYRNVNSFTVKLYRLPIETYSLFLKGDLSRWNFVPPEQYLIWQATQRSSAQRDENTLQEFIPLPSGAEALTPGFYFLTLDAPEIENDSPYEDSRIVMVASDNLTFKTTSTDVLVWATDLSTGAPTSNLQVSVFDDNFQFIGQGVTGADGSLFLNVPEAEESYGSRYIVAGVEGEAGRRFAFASSAWGSGVSPYDFGIWGDYYSFQPTNQPRAYIYTERPIYRPGQPVYFKGVVRLDDDLAYSLPALDSIGVTIDSYDETVYNEELPLSEYGTFAGEFTLDSQATLGYYSVSVYDPENGGSIGWLSFNVAEYRKPEFLVEVTATPAAVLSGETFEATINAEYYSGGPLVNAEVYWTLSAEAYDFYPTDQFSNFNFTDFDYDAFYYYDYTMEMSEIVADGYGQTDENGQLILTLPANLSEAKTGQRYSLEATVTDLSGFAVSGRANLVAHRSQVYAGIRALEYVGREGQAQTFELAAVDWDSNPVSGQVLQVEIVERRWNSIQVQDEQGRVTWETEVENIPVETFSDIASGADGKASVRFTPPGGGLYKAVVTTQDPQGNTARASTYLWVAGSNYIPWRQTNDRSFSLVADREVYAPGDTAELLIASPFQGEAYALVTVERGRIRQHEVIRLETNSTVYPLALTADMAPNVYVSVLIIKGVDEFNPRPDFRLSLLELQVEPSQQTLTVELIPDKAQAAPGETVTYQVRVTDASGSPVSAEVSLSLSDLATLSLMNPNSAPILDYFYSERGLSVRTAVPIVNSLEDYNVEIDEYLNEGEGMGSGGGKGGFDVFGVVEVRENFPDTAFWEAFVHTDAQGEATVSITLPDNLTTWRMEARAVTVDTRVGQSTVDIVSTKALLIRPQTPRFFVVGDQAILGAAVHNNTDQALSVAVTLEAEGLSLSTEPTQQVDLPARQQAYVTWEVLVDAQADRVDLVFKAQGGDYTDATRPTLGTLDNQGIPVYRYEAPETVGTSGLMLEGGTIVEAINLPQAFTIPEVEAVGSLTVKVSPSLAASFTDGLTYLKSYPYECVEQTISRFLPNVLTAQALRQASEGTAFALSDPETEAGLNEQVYTALQRLYNWQNPDGGWGWWSDQESNPLTSAYVVFALVEARAAGYTVDSTTLEDGLDYLQYQLRPIRRLESPDTLNRQAFFLYVLARAGEPDVSQSVQLYEQRQRLALYARAYLAQTLYWIDPGDARIQTLLSDFNTAAILSATGAHWEEDSDDFWNWNTDTRTTAIILSALSVIDAENPLTANAVRWLMSHRTQGHWSGTQETAWAIMALTRWMEASGELQADYQYGLALNGERVGGGIASAESLRETYELSLSVSELLTDQTNRLAIARDAGAGNLYYTVHLNVTLPVDQIDALDQGIIIARRYYRLDDRVTPVTEAAQGELLLVQLTIVAPHALHYVMVDDPFPAGLEAVDQSLLTSPQAPDMTDYNWEDFIYHGWGWWYFSHVQLRDERLVLSADYLPAGTYVYSYLVRASTPGVFRVIPPTAQEFYFPEVYGRGDGSTFTVGWSLSATP